MAPDSSFSGKTDEFKDRERLILELQKLREAYTRQAEVIERYERLYKDGKKPAADVYEELEVQRELIKLLNRQLKDMQNDIEDQNEREISLEELGLGLEEQLRAGEALDRNYALLKAITDGTPDPVYIKDRESRILMCNPALLRIYGRPLEEVVGKTDKELYDDPAIGEAIVANDRKVMGSGRSMAIEEVASTPDGLRTFISTKTPYRDSRGNIIGIIGISRDITERKRAEEVLRYQSTLLANISDAIVGVDAPVQRITSWNPAAERMYGYSAGEVIGRSILEVLRPEYPGYSRDELVEKLMRTGMLDVEAIHYTKDGRAIYVESHAVALRDSQGRIIGSVGVNRNITGRKLAEEAIRESEARFREMAGTISSAFWISEFDATGRLGYVYMSPAFERIFGIPVERIYEDPQAWLKMIHPEDSERFFAAQEKRAAGEYVDAPDFRIVKPDGSIVWVKTSLFPVKGEGGKICRYVGLADDITERRRAEEARRDSEAQQRRQREFLESLIEHAGSGIAVLQGRELRFKLVNSTYQAIAPHIPMVGKTYREVFPEAADAGAEERVQRVIDTGETWVVEAYHGPIPGKPDAMWQGYVVRLPIEDGQEPSVFSIVWDVTDRMRAEEALHERERMYSLVFEKSPVMMVLSRLDDGTIVNVNKQWVKTLGFARDELIGKKSSDLGINRDFEGRAAILRELQQKGSIRNAEMPMYKKSGEKFIISNNLNIVELDGVKYQLGVSYDITVRKRAEEALRESERKFMLIFNKAAAPMAISRYSDGTFINVNERWVETFGYSREEAIGKTSAELGIHRDIEVRVGRLAELQQKGSVHDVETHLYAKSGREFLFSNYMNVVELDGEKFLLTTVYDITDKKLVEKALMESKQQAELYLDLMGHDINNLHQIALGYLELARDMPPGDRQTEFLDKPVEVLQRSAQLIKNVRKLQNLHDGVFMTEDVDVCKVISDVQREFGANPHKAVTLNLNGLDSCHVRANELLHDLYANLVSNAIKHTGDKANIIIDLDIVKDDGGRYCRVMVEDDGPGIPDDFKGKIFNRMLKGNGAKGMGLGLYLVKSLVTSYGGRVWVEDRVIGHHKKGARFVVMLPIA